jgi:putative transcriptional regulator
MVREEMIKERDKRQWKQEYLAGLLGTTQQNISLIENGKRKPTIRLARKIEQLYNRPMEELFPDIFFTTHTTKRNVKQEISA